MATVTVTATDRHVSNDEGRNLLGLRPSLRPRGRIFVRLHESGDG